MSGRTDSETDAERDADIATVHDAGDRPEDEDPGDRPEGGDLDDLGDRPGDEDPGDRSEDEEPEDRAEDLEGHSEDEDLEGQDEDVRRARWTATGTGGLLTLAGLAAALLRWTGSAPVLAPAAYALGAVVCALAAVLGFRGRTRRALWLLIAGVMVMAVGDQFD
ncbi:hypothetical protein ACFV0T_23605 [Streptomyces sp. NPDC059582]|uniref:hypothetical protein n=1 Tax=Streptomyces sp. NPDC059582 TaxID=3346875 RepID=UPI00367CB89E